MMPIPLVDLKIQYEQIKSEIDSAVKEAMNEANFILGPQVKALEQKIREYCGVNYAVGVASGTDALVLALTALGIGKGDEVITTPFTFIATAEAISRTGARPVFCDIDAATFNIDADKIKDRITGRTKAILPVHLYGRPCEMDPIMSLAKERGLKVIEDNAQGFGCEYKDKKGASLGDAGCLSFFPGKNLGCYGDAGMIVTNDGSLAERIMMLRNHGSSKKYYYGMHGFNSRLDTLQAAVLLVKMDHIDKWIGMRIKNAMSYNKMLSPLGITCPAVSGHIKHSFNYYTIRAPGKRVLIQETLKKDGIASAVYYPLSLHLQEVYKELGYKQGDFPVAEKAQEETLSLPMYPELSEEQIEETVRSIKKAL